MKHRETPTQSGAITVPPTLAWGPIIELWADPAADPEDRWYSAIERWNVAVREWATAAGFGPHDLLPLSVNRGSGVFAWSFYDLEATDPADIARCLERAGLPANWRPPT